MSGGKKQFLVVVAIDEAGRGPLAGPISIGAVLSRAEAPAGPDVSSLFIKNARIIPEWFQKLSFENGQTLAGIKDSKKLSAKQREVWFKKITANFCCVNTLVGPHVIDDRGIQKAAKKGISRVLSHLVKNELAGMKPDLVIMDGSLEAPRKFSQISFIKGDEKIPIVSAASIIAKVKRDTKMKRLGKIFPEYALDVHKGYGTKAHYSKLVENGISSCHRLSFLKKLKRKKRS